MPCDARQCKVTQPMQLGTSAGDGALHPSVYVCTHKPSVAMLESVPDMHEWYQASRACFHTLLGTAERDSTARCWTPCSVGPRLCQTQSSDLGAQELTTRGSTGQGWPKLLLHVEACHTGRDAWAGGPVSTRGYAVVALPNTSGHHVIEARCFSPVPQTHGQRFTCVP